MTSREGFDAYCLYLAINNHFHTESYDYFKYNGKVPVKLPAFLKRNDKYHFAKLAREHRDELRDFLVANLSQQKYYVKNLLDQECVDNYKEFKKCLKNKIFVKNFKNLEEILKEIFFDIKKDRLKKNIILFSPAGASFDRFKNFEDRGLYFNQIIKKFLNAK